MPWPTRLANLLHPLASPENVMARVPEFRFSIPTFMNIIIGLTHGYCFVLLNSLTGEGIYARLNLPAGSDMYCHI